MIVSGQPSSGHVSGDSLATCSMLVWVLLAFQGSNGQAVSDTRWYKHGVVVHTSSGSGDHR